MKEHTLSCFQPTSGHPRRMTTQSHVRWHRVNRVGACRKQSQRVPRLTHQAAVIRSKSTYVITKFCAVSSIISITEAKQHQESALITRLDGELALQLHEHEANKLLHPPSKRSKTDSTLRKLLHSLNVTKVREEYILPPVITHQCSPAHLAIFTR